jgi:hypothetical protein
LEPVTRAICCFMSLTESSLIIIIVKDIEQDSTRALWLENLGPSGREVISLQKEDSLLVFLNITGS